MERIVRARPAFFAFNLRVDWFHWSRSGFRGEPETKAPMKEKTDLETPGQERKKRPPLKEELSRFLGTFPDKVLFLTLTGLWFLLFHLFGNSTFGYTDTSSLFGWLNYDYGMKAGDEHGYLVPFAFLALIWYEKSS